MKIKFVTLNTWHGGVLFDNMLLFLKKENADILNLQEVNDKGSEKLPRNFRTISELTKQLQLSYFEFSPALFHFKQGEKVEHGNAVLSKFPITFLSTIFFDKKYCGFDWESRTDFGNVPPILQHVVLHVNGKDIDLFNVHGVWGQDGKDNQRRLNMSETIISQIKDRQRVILAGDFNVVPDTQTIRNIENKLTNVFGRELVSTFNMKHKESLGYATSVVDMIFVSKSIQVINHYQPSVDVSDHLPLVCELDI